MKIIVNGKFLTQNVTGVQRFAREILLELDKLVKKGSVEIAAPKGDYEIPNYENIEVVKIGDFKGNLWEQISLPLYAIKRKATLLNMCNASPLIKPDIVCLHDAKIKAKPEYFSKKFLYWYRLLFFNAAKRGKHIITVSNFSKKELIKYYKIPENKITVIYDAWQHYERISYDENTLAKYNLQKKQYYFAMSSLEPNKNFKWIAETAKNNPNETFAIAGSLNSKVFAESLNMTELENVKFLGYVSDAEAKTLMRDCKAFLFPSFYEGFGIPPLEAMSCEANSIVSNIPCLVEIFGSTVSYIEPENFNIKLVEVVKSITDGKKNVLEEYSWVKSAKKLYKLICTEPDV